MDMTTFFDAVTRSPRLRWLVPVAIAGMLASCTPSKVAQCNRLSETVNKMRPIAEQFQQENNNFEAAAKAASAKNNFNGVKVAAASTATAFSGLTGKMDGLIKEIEAVDLQDETLVNLKNRYVQNASAINASFKEITSALTTVSQLENSQKGLQDLNMAGRSLTQSANTMNGLIRAETQLVGDFNKYCDVK